MNTKTNWLTKSGNFFIFNCNPWLCGDKLLELFDIPDDIQYIRLHFSSHTDKDSLPIYLNYDSLYIHWGRFKNCNKILFF